ncbi:hypothetical protein KY310_02650 [Candidatus Woesearchaeota archaeon]|nr:hypothetical protein [Candidatus Woesearchaeota archaeon]
MDVNEAYKALKKNFTVLPLKGKTLSQLEAEARKSELVPVPWFFAATGYALREKKDKFKECLENAAEAYRKNIEKRGEIEPLTTQLEATSTLAENVDEAFELVREGVR